LGFVCMCGLYELWVSESHIVGILKVGTVFAGG
jgi:hypothetical protein